ncbi:MAG: hypothetical protein QNI84_17425 [Henriciella sp.]|nr:hypothetical protein [Henriciella sp.]
MPCYIDLNEAQAVLSEMGVKLNERQMKRAAEMDATGKRKLPFFLDPIDGRLKIEKGTLVRIYHQLQADAEKKQCKVLNNCLYLQSHWLFLSNNVGYKKKDRQ